MEHLDEIERGLVGPMEVVDEQHRRLRRYGTENQRRCRVQAVHPPDAGVDVEVRLEQHQRNVEGCREERHITGELGLPGQPST